MGFFGELFGAISQAVDNANEAVRQKYNELLSEDDDELRRIEKSTISNYSEKTAAHQILMERVDSQEKVLSKLETEVLMAMIAVITPGSEFYDIEQAQAASWSDIQAILRILVKREEMTQEEADDFKEVLC